MHIPFQNTFSKLPDTFYQSIHPTPVSNPKLIAFNHQLAKVLGIDSTDTTELAAIFSGNIVPSGAEPLAQLYSGHQFGHWAPQLGDGRAILLGEIIGIDGTRRDIQLKGSGRTKYSRMGDGRAWLGPVLREFTISEAMHHLGIPTSRALAAVATSDPVYREQGALPGAILTRIATSHLRIGTFQIFAARGEINHLKQLTEYAIERHYPDADGPMGLLRHVCDVQAKLVAQWMSVGFIHGVMNTDNCSISGETIDYGPCAFMDTYHPETVYSSIDQFGRYAYANQSKIIVWNLAQLATALIQQCTAKDAAIEEATDIIQKVPDLHENYWTKFFLKKIGITQKRKNDRELINSLLEIMADNQADFTNTFRELSGADGRRHFKDPTIFDQWKEKWMNRLTYEETPESVMQSANPAFIPRNHRIEQMISSALADNFVPFETLSQVLSFPYQDQADHDQFKNPPKPDEVVQATFCGT